MIYVNIEAIASLNKTMKKFITRRLFTSCAFILIITGLNFEYNSLKAQMPAQSKEIKSFKETPEFIKAYLDIVEHGKFLIAEKAEKWNSGCVRTNGEPTRQFIAAFINDDTYTLDYWQGGFAMIKKQLEVNFKNEKVTGYSQHDITNAKH